MNPARLLAHLPIGRKFSVVLLLQTLFLALVGFLGLHGIESSQRGVKEVGAELAKAQAVARVLNDTNVLRTVHVSMIAAAKNEAYLAKRRERLTTYEARLAESLAKLAALPWTPETSPLAEKGARAVKAYCAGFAAALEQAKALKGGEASGEIGRAHV